MIIMIYLISCGGENNVKNESSEAEEENLETFDESIEEEIEIFLKELPAPSEIPYMIEKTGADYNESLVNDLAKADEYKSTNFKTAVNIGVYGADIAYLCSYIKSQKALDYLSKIRDLADYIKVTTAFDVEAMEKFEKNLDDPRVLAAVIDESIQKTTDILRDDYRTKTAIYVVSGGYLEGMYLSCGLVSTYPKDKLLNDELNKTISQIITLISDQEDAIDNLVSLLSTIKEDPNIAELSKNLMLLKESLNDFNEKEKLSETRADLLLQDEDLINIVELVTSIRADLIRS